MSAEETVTPVVDERFESTMDRTCQAEDVRERRRGGGRKGSGIYAEIQDLRAKLQEQQAVLDIIKTALNSAALSLNGGVQYDVDSSGLQQPAERPRRNNGNCPPRYWISGNAGRGRGGYKGEYSSRGRHASLD